MGSRKLNFRQSSPSRNMFRRGSDRDDGSREIHILGQLFAINSSQSTKLTHKISAQYDTAQSATTTNTVWPLNWYLELDCFQRSRQHHNQPRQTSKVGLKNYRFFLHGMRRLRALTTACRLRENPHILIYHFTLLLSIVQSDESAPFTHNRLQRGRTLKQSLKLLPWALSNSYRFVAFQSACFQWRARRSHFQ